MGGLGGPLVGVLAIWLVHVHKTTRTGRRRPSRCAGLRRCRQRGRDARGHEGPASCPHVICWVPASEWGGQHAAPPFPACDTFVGTRISVAIACATANRSSRSRAIRSQHPPTGTTRAQAQALPANVLAFRTRPRGSRRACGSWSSHGTSQDVNKARPIIKLNLHFTRLITNSIGRSATGAALCHPAHQWLISAVNSSVMSDDGDGGADGMLSHGATHVATNVALVIGAAHPQWGSPTNQTPRNVAKCNVE